MLTIKEIQPDNFDKFLALGKSAFDPLTASRITIQDLNLAAWQDDELVGGFIAAIVGEGESRVGIVRWLFVDEKARGQGLGSTLIDAGLEALRAQNVERLVCDIDGDNPSSFKLIVAKGGRQLTPWAQLRAFGPLMTARIWWNLTHFLDFGFSIYGWVPSTKSTPTKPTPYRKNEELFSLLLFLLVVTVAALRRGLSLMPVLLAALLLWTLQESVTWGVARLQGLKTRHVAWESTVPLGLLIGASFGVIFPPLGGRYPAQPDWRAQDERKRRGRASAAAMLSVALVLLLTGPLSLLPAGPEWIAFAEALRFVGLAILLFGVIIIFPPFTAFPAARIWRWEPFAFTLLMLFTLYLWVSPV